MNNSTKSVKSCCIYIRLRVEWTQESEVRQVNKISVDTIRRNIKSLRVKAGYTQESAANELEVSRETMFRWEKEPQLMPIMKLAKLASLYECNINDFFAD